MRIDARKNKQYFKNVNGLNNVYVWKEKDKTYSVGINGTSHHHGHMEKVKAETMVTKLTITKN